MELLRTGLVLTRLSTERTASLVNPSLTRDLMTDWMTNAFSRVDIRN